MTNLDETHKAAWRSFLTASALLFDRIDGEMQAAGVVSMEWYDVLLALEEAPEQRLRMSELARAVLFSRSGLTRLIDRMEQAGLTCRQPCAADRRVTYVVLTDAGRAARERAWSVYSPGIVTHFARHIEEPEADQLTEWMNRLIQSQRDS